MAPPGKTPSLTPNSPLSPLNLRTEGYHESATKKDEQKEGEADLHRHWESLPQDTPSTSPVLKRKGRLPVRKAKDEASTAQELEANASLELDTGSVLLPEAFRESAARSSKGKGKATVDEALEETVQITAPPGAPLPKGQQLAQRMQTLLEVLNKAVNDVQADAKRDLAFETHKHDMNWYEMAVNNPKNNRKLLLDSAAAARAEYEEVERARAVIRGVRSALSEGQPIERYHMALEELQALCAELAEL